VRYVSPALWILVASFLFATMSALVKVAAADVSLPAIVLFRALPAALSLFVFARARGLVVFSGNLGLHAFRCVVGVGSMTCGFYAITQLPLATSTTLEYTAPLFMVVHLALLARRHLSAMAVGTMLIGFVGVLLLLKPTLQAGQALPFLAGLASGALAAIAYRQIRRLGEAGEPAWRIVLLYSLAALVLSIAGLPFASASTYTLRGVAALAGVGIVGMLAQLAMTRAFSQGSTTLLATLQYSTVVFSAIYGIAFWGDQPTLSGTVGLLLIMLAGIIAARTAGRVR